MFKRISAVLLAVSVMAAPALAATSTKTNQAPVTKQAPVKTNANNGVKTNTLNANAKMDSHHVSHHRYHRHHKISALKTHKTHTKVSFKLAKPSTKRG